MHTEGQLPWSNSNAIVAIPSIVICVIEMIVLLIWLWMYIWHCFPVKSLIDITNEVQRQVDGMRNIQTDTEEERARMQKLIEKGYGYIQV